MRAEEVVRYARWFKELIKGNVDVQSRARLSYRAVVMPTDALLTFGMLKLTSLMMGCQDQCDPARWVMTTRVWQSRRAAEVEDYTDSKLQPLRLVLRSGAFEGYLFGVYATAGEEGASSR